MNLAGGPAGTPLAPRLWRYFVEKPSEREARRTASILATEVQERGLVPAQAEQRRAALDNAIMAAAARGAVVEHRGEFDVLLRYNRKVNHVAHAILSLLTAGVWLLVWLVLVIYTRPDRTALRVDEYGRVTETKTAS